MLLQLFGCLLFESSEIIVPVDVNDTGIATVDTANDTDTEETGTTTETDDSDTDTQDTEDTDTQDTNDTDTGLDCVPEAEICDGLDNDCDGLLDGGEMDQDGDGYISCTFDENIWVGDSTVIGGDDCDDTDATVYPSAPELCDGLDNDCDSILPVDETDADGDSYVGCTIDSNGWDGDSYVVGGNDCSDSNAAVHAILPYYLDSDGDGFGSPDFETIVCEPLAGYILDNTDCDDGNAAIYPNATEACDGLDNACNLSLPADESDDDGDGYVECTIDIMGWSGDSNVVGGDDCDDTDTNEFPGQAWYADWDGDGFGNSSSVQINCSQLYATTLDSTDCDDTDNTVYPNATELCDGQVNACGNSMPSEEHDGDGDGFVECTIDSNGWDGYGNIQGDDCDDSNSSINPDTEWYADTDGDGFGDAGNTITQCIQPNGFIADNTDCDDTDALSNPNGTEIAADGIDQDCNGVDLTEITMADVQVGDLLLTEVLYYGYGGQNDDWFEVYNNSGSDINLLGLLVQTNNDSFTVTSNTILPADEYIVFIESSQSSLNGNFPLNQANYIETGLLLSDLGNTLDLQYQGVSFVNVYIPSRYVLGTPQGTSWILSDYDAPQDDIDNWCLSNSLGYQLGPDTYISTPGIPNDSCDQDGDGEYYYDCDDSDATLNIDDLDGDGYSTCDGDCDDNDPTLTLDDFDADGVTTCDGDCDDGNPAVGADDIDGDGFSACTTDCDDTDPSVYPGAVDIMNDGIDQDCDGVDLTGLTAIDLVPGDLTITEVQNYTSNRDTEWYEFFNNTNEVIDLMGLTLQTDDRSHDITTHFMMPSGAYFVAGREANANQNGGINLDIETRQDLDRNNDAISIVYNDGSTITTIAEIIYVNADSWDTNRGVSKIVYDSQIPNNNDVDLWCTSTTLYVYEDDMSAGIDLYGTPGAPNDTCDYDLDGQFIGDCDNEDPAIFTGVAYLDNPQECMEDQDGDGWGWAHTTGSVVGGNDCHDGNAILNGDDLDNDGLSTCDGDCDDGDPWVMMTDNDGDGQSNCSTSWSMDCDDGDPNTYMGAAYRESRTICMTDNDGDGYGAPNTAMGVTPGTDCDDTNGNRYPGKAETANGVDDDCDGTIDEGTVNYDDDGDGYSENQGDCKDNNANAYPGAAYLESSTLCMADNDGDGYGNSTPSLGVTAGSDCDDYNPIINPGEPEIVGDGIDQNCDGVDDTGLQTAQ